MTSINNKPFGGWKRTLVTQALVLCAIWAGYRYFNPPVPETPIEAEQRRQSEARVAAYNEKVAKQEAEQEAARSAYRDQQCQASPVCVAYKAARNECAIAANFNNCVHIKINSNDYDKLVFCNDDGTLAPAGFWPNLSAPSTLECWFRNNTAFYK